MSHLLNMRITQTQHNFMNRKRDHWLASFKKLLERLEGNCQCLMEKNALQSYTFFFVTLHSRTAFGMVI